MARQTTAPDSIARCDILQILHCRRTCWIAQCTRVLVYSVLHSCAHVLCASYSQPARVVCRRHLLPQGPRRTQCRSAHSAARGERHRQHQEVCKQQQGLRLSPGAAADRPGLIKTGLLQCCAQRAAAWRCVWSRAGWVAATRRRSRASRGRQARGIQQQTTLAATQCRKPYADAAATATGSSSWQQVTLWHGV